jgi:YggT family protein
MALAATIGYVAAEVYLLVLLARLVLDVVQLFARMWRPRGPLLVAAELIYTVTDPPLRLARRVIPPFRLGSVSLDLAFAVVMILVSVLASVLYGIALTSVRGG